MGILWNYTGNVSSNSATPVAKIGYDYGSNINSYKVFTLTYNGSTMSLYVDNELITTVTKNEAGLSKISELFIGADYDDTTWFKGNLPELIFYNNELSEFDRTNLVNHLKNKWVNGNETNIIINSAEAFLHFNETSLVFDENDRVVSWIDLINNRELLIKPNTTLSYTTTNNKRALYFDNKSYLKLEEKTGDIHNPDNISIVFIALFDDLKKSSYGEGAQTLISSTDNYQFRIKKFDEDDFLSYRIRDWDGVTYYLDIPDNKILGSTMIEGNVGELSLYFQDQIIKKDLNNYVDYGIGKFPLENLTPNTKYSGVFALNGVIDESTRFNFKTLPEGATSFKIVTGSCNRTGSEAPTWDKIKEEKPDLFIHLGDLNYLDLNTQSHQEYAKGLDISMSNKIKSLLREVSFVYQYDNHDSLRPTPDKNDISWTAFLEFFTKAHSTYTPASETPIIDGMYYSFTIGRVKCIVTDCRRSRDPQREQNNPEKSVLGPNQKKWFKDELLESKNNPNIEATIWFSQILWTADRNNPNGDSFDSWGASWASYEDERTEIANFIYDNKIKNIATVCADVHMQAIDDGRNGCYITDANGDRVDPNTIDKAYWMPMLEASPFDQYLDYDGGPFNINDMEGSGGPTGSSEQSYGVVEVLDTGNKWLQVKLYTMALINNVWVRNRYFTFNWVADNGGDLVPPPLNWADINNVNENGYIFNETWKPIKNRFITIGNEYKPQIMKWKFISGKWRKVYDINTYDPNNPLTLSHLNNWTAERENVIEIHGNGFLDVSYPSNYGGYYTFSKNGADLFGNFPYVTELGDVLYSTKNDKTSVYVDENNYIQLPNLMDSGILFNTFYDRDFFIGIRFLVENEKRFNVLSNESKTYGIFVENGLVTITFSDVSFTKEILIGEWNYLGLNVKVSDLGKYTFLYLNDTKEELINFKVSEMPKAVDSPITTILGGEGNGYLGNFYYLPRYATETQALRYLKEPSLDIILKNDNDSYVIPEEWVMSKTNQKLLFTIPPNAISGQFKVNVESINYKSNSLPLNIIEPNVDLVGFSTKFQDISDLKDNFFILHKQWGGANGGVSAENVEYHKGKLKLFGNGDLYSGKIQGVNRDGDPKFHTHIDDPKLGLPWTNRVGACMIYNKRTGFGSYRLKAKIPTVLGMCSAIWTFYYNEIYPSDLRWNDFIDEGLHKQGNLEDGFYMTRNHEIDIEFPSHLDGGNYVEPSFNNMKCNTWIGELQNWDVPKDHPEYWEEYRDNLTPTGINMYDNQEHELRFDWYEDRVEFYIDGELKRINSGSTIPNIAGYFTFGVWFPSSPMVGKPWLVRPDRAWAGGVIDEVDGSRKAMFDRVSMDISEFSYTPFDNSNLRVTGETYPFGTYRKYE